MKLNKRFYSEKTCGQPIMVIVTKMSKRTRLINKTPTNTTFFAVTYIFESIPARTMLSKQPNQCVIYKC